MDSTPMNCLSNPIFGHAIVKWAMFVTLFILTKACLGRDESAAARSLDPVVQEINLQIKATWKDNEVEASPTADDAEWVRRVYLDIVGHIPAIEDAETFLSD